MIPFTKADWLIFIILGTMWLVLMMLMWIWGVR